MASKNVPASKIESYSVGTGWVDNSSESSVWTWDRSFAYGGYKVVRVSFPSMAIGGGTITGATLYMKTKTLNYPYDGVELYARLSASNTAEAYTTDIASNYATIPKDYYSNTVVAYNVASIIPYISDANSAFCLFFILAQGDDQAETEFQRWSESYSDYQPYLSIEYTPAPNSTIGLYNGSAFTDRIIKKRVSGAWVDCDCYKYNSTTSTWEKVSTT
jgi:hypothetical protein